MNKRLRSRVLAIGVVSSSLFAAGVMLYDTLPARAQEKPTPVEILERGSKLYKEQQYQEAKKVLLEIDPAQLPEAERVKRDDLIKQTDLALAKSAPSTETFDSAKAALDAGQLAQANKLYEAVASSPNATPELKQNARIQLELVKQKQKDKAPSMKALLKDAIAAYDAGRLDDAQNALNTIAASGSDLGWADNGKPAKYQKLINEKRAALAQAPEVKAPAAAPAAVAATPAAGETPAPVASATPVEASAGVAVVTTAPAVATTVPAVPTDDLLGQHIATRTIVQQQAIAHYDHFKELATVAITAGNYQAGVDNAKEAKAVAETSADLFSATESAALLKDADELLKTAQAKAQVAKNLADQQAVKDAAQNEKILVANRSLEKQARIKALMDMAAAAAERQQYDQAISILNQVIVIEPSNSSAQYMRRDMEDKKNFRVWQKTEDLKSRENVRQMVDNNEYLVPYADLMIYPEDWPELTRRRQSDQQISDTDINKKVRELLDTELDQLNIEGVSLKKTIDNLQTKMREKMPSANIEVNWNALRTGTQEVRSDKEITVNLRNVPFRKALSTVLMEASDGSGILGYTIDAGVITISTKDDLNSPKYQVVRVYDIREMLVQSNNTGSAPALNISTTTTTVSSDSSSSSGGNDSFNNDNTSTDTGAGANDRSRADIVTEITDTIKATVAPNSWVDTGGTIGSIRELNGQLIVNQTVENQVQVYSLLQKLSEQHSLQVAIETRLLLVGNNFLDDFGLGWSLTAPMGGLGSSISTATITNNTNTMASSPTTGVPGSLGGNALGANALDLSATGQILDNFQLSVLIRATQADKRTSTVTAPRVTIRDGDTGWISVTNQQNYVSNFSQNTSSGGVNGNGTLGTNLEVSTLNTGVTLTVSANVSPDRRYVTMTLQPQLASLDGIDTFVVSSPAAAAVGAATGGNTTGTPTGGTTTGGTTGSTTGGSSGSLTTVGGAFVQLPRITQTTVRTTVQVPDGGTLLIGGQKIVGEAEIEVGVPVLSKIPGLNRLFTNRSYTKDERTLLILVRPKIIIQREEEYKNFGMNFDVTPAGASATSIGGSADASVK